MDTYLSAFHGLDSILHFVERKFLNHAFDGLMTGECNHFFTIERMTTRQAMNRGAFDDD